MTQTETPPVEIPRRTPEILVSLLAGLLAGGVIGYLLAPSAPPPAAAPQSEQNTQAVKERALGRRGDAPDGPSPRHSGGYSPSLLAIPAPEVSDDLAAELRAVMDKVEATETPKGAGVIRGHVRLADGSGLEGVEVRASVRQYFRAEDAPARLEDEVAEVIRRRRFERSIERTAVTGHDGAYEIMGIAESVEYWIKGSKPGYKVEYNNNIYRTLRAGATADLLAYAIGVVEVVLRMPDGSPAPYGRMRWGRTTLNSGGPWQGPVHKLELEPGSWSISAESGEEGPDFFSDPVTVEVKLGEPPQRLEIQLKGRRGITGRLNVPLVLAGARFRVEAQRDPTDGPPKVSRESGVSPPWFNNPRRSNGFTFRFDDLKPGRYRVVAWNLDGTPADWREVEVRDGFAEISLRIPDPKAADFIVVRVYGASGEVLRDAEINLSVTGPGLTTESPGAEIRQPDGSIWLPRTASGAEPEQLRGKDWHYSLWVRARGLPPKTVTYGRNDTHEVEVRLAEAANLTVNIPGADEHPARAKLRLQLVKRGARFDPHAPGDGVSLAGRTRALDGKRRFEARDAGDYDLLLHLETGGFDSAELTRQPLTLAAGENEATVAIPPLNALTVTLPAGSRATYLRVRKKGEAEERARVITEIKDGRATIDHLPEGEYVVFNQSGEVEVRIPAQSEVVFNPAPYNALRMKAKAGGQVEALGFRDGDIIVRIDGSEFNSVTEGWNLIQAAQAKEATTWQVLRAGVATDVTFDGRELARIVRETGDNEFKPVPCYR